MRKILFLFNSDWIHEATTDFGSFLGKQPIFRKIFNYLYNYKDTLLEQSIKGIMFPNPVGLAAGFDYDAKLTQILPSLGFGFSTVGTITNMSYEGNPPPRLGRLVKSKSLLVNKGFKNSGAKSIIKKLRNLDFNYPLGISIGKTNSPQLVTQKESVEDIFKAFKSFENSNIKNSYYELNISCPNLSGNISFYPPKNLEELLKAVDKLKIKKPVLVKMPISKTDKETLAMLKVIAKHSIVGVIFGNLQTNRYDKELDKDEVEKFKKGNFSGKPTYKRSNELIRLAYKHYNKRFIIIGCGGIFNASDAYEKIKLGASLVQLVTGLVYEGPVIAAKISIELIELLKKDGHVNISSAIGVKAKLKSS